jgi:hypothetical protein
MDLTQSAIEFLNEALHLPASGREQDWDIELADPARIREFIQLSSKTDLDDEKQFALMALILASLEDLSYQGDIPSDVWKDIADLLQAHPKLYSDLLDQWAAKDGDDFGISLPV